MARDRNTRSDREEQGGFNPDRPKKSSPMQPVGPMPTDDPKGKATPDLKAKIKKQAEEPRR